MVAPFIRGAGRLVRRSTPSPWPWSGFLGLGGGVPVPRPGARRSPGFGEFVEQQEFESLFPPALPFRGAAFSSPGRFEPSGVVEPPLPLPGVRRAEPMLDPQDINFVNPRLAPPEPPPIRVLPPEEEALTAWQSGAFEPRQTLIGLRGGGEMRYTPLLPDEIRDIERAVREDPGRAYLSVLMNYDEARTPQEFGRAMEQARALRQNMVMDPQYEAALNSALARAAVRFGVPETKFEEYISPILYTNSRQLPRQVSRVGSELEEVSEASVTSNQFRIDTNKAIKNAKRSADLDDIDTTNGGLVGRALASGEISEMDAKRLIDQTNYTRIRLLQNEGVLPKGFNNNVRAKGGKRGIDLLENMSELSEVNKARLYKVAIQTAETNDEVAQVYSLAVRDLTSPALLDELDTVLDGKAAYFGRIEGVTPERLARPVDTTIDEASIRQANVEQAALDARRANADDTRPAFPSENVDPEDTIVNAFLATDENGKQVIRTKLGEKEKWVRDKNGETIPVTLGGGTSRTVDTSLSVPPPDPSVPFGSSSMTPPYEMNSGGYLPRTIANAQEGDITIAIASDFTTGGEKLTVASARGMRRAVKNSAGKWEAEYGKPGDFGRINEIEQIPHLSPDVDSYATSIVNKLNRISAERGRPVVINGAGNGLASLRSQDEADAYARHVINRIVNHPDRAFEIDYVVTGGQNGYDIAIAKAAKAYGIPIKINPAYTSNGSVMLQDPFDSKKIIFMKRADYIRKHKLDTAEIGADY